MTEIAQFALGDLTFKVHYPHYIYSSALVKVLRDTGRAILTSIPSYVIYNKFNEQYLRQLGGRNG